jgi:hypothetical protein
VPLDILGEESEDVETDKRLDTLGANIGHIEVFMGMDGVLRSWLVTPHALATVL